MRLLTRFLQCFSNCSVNGTDDHHFPAEMIFLLQHTKESVGNVKSTENLMDCSWADQGAGKPLFSPAGFLPSPLSLCDSCYLSYPSCGISVMPLPTLLQGYCCSLTAWLCIYLINQQLGHSGCSGSHLRGEEDLAFQTTL